MNTQKAAVIGHPIGHTMSPFIQKRLFELSNIPMEYRVIDVPDLGAAVPELRKLDCFNITIPHKSAIIMLGNGGAARAIAFQAAIQQKDFDITIAHREGSYERAMGLANELADYARGRGDKAFRVTVMSYKELEDEPDTRYSLLVNTTSVGMYPNVDACPVSGKVIERCGAVFDAVFNPGETKLLKAAGELGIKTVPGMGMLVCQAAYSHKIWYDTEFKNEDILQLIEDAQAELQRKFGGRA